ncbi:MAG: hypothetical protein EA401_03000 [Planctomycetota bacterium]|nr:MAG: hypothetical protein EA401_03000 [Planctomycetota bacterium]
MATPVDSSLYGQTLGADVRDTRGQVLLKAGTVLNQKHLRTLKLWGVSRVLLSHEVATGSQQAVIDRKQLERYAVHERQRFCRCDLGHPLLHHLYLLAIRRQVATGQGQNDA